MKKPDEGGVGLSQARADELITCNTFRHTAASIWSKLFDMETAGVFLGHKKYQTTKDYYLNVYLDYVTSDMTEMPYNFRSVHGGTYGGIKLPTSLITVDLSQVSKNQGINAG